VHIPRRPRPRIITLDRGVEAVDGDAIHHRLHGRAVGTLQLDADPTLLASTTIVLPSVAFATAAPIDACWVDPSCATRRKGFEVVVMAGSDPSVNDSEKLPASARVRSSNVAVPVASVATLVVPFSVRPPSTVTPTSSASTGLP
jgi:hypothetical protein